MRQRDLMDVIEQVLADPALTKADAEFLESIKDRLKASRNEFEIGAAIVERSGPTQFAQNSAHRSPEDP